MRLAIPDRPWALPALLILVAGGVLLFASRGARLEPEPAWAQSPPANTVVITYGVGGVLTADGTLWQYRPDLARWMTIDEAFKEEGRATKVLPLPVPVDQIAELETWGFFRTKSGDLWLYEISIDTWKKLSPPGR